VLPELPARLDRDDAIVLANPSRSARPALGVLHRRLEHRGRCGRDGRRRRGGQPGANGFGVDSFIESTSGSILIWRLRSEVAGAGKDEEAIERVERTAERLVGLAFLVLAAYVAFEGTRSLATSERPEESPVGITLTALSIVVMLWLARAKRETGEALDSRALIADAAQTFACW
jgi:hypothetical protein